MGRTKASDVAEAMTLSPTDRAATASSSSSLPAVAAASSFEQPKKRRPARLPGPLQFPLVVVLNFGLSSLAHSFFHGWTNGELGTIASQPVPPSEVVLLAAWKIFELALAWFGNYDGYDLAALSLLSHGPFLYLLYTFYNISAKTIGVYLGTGILSSVVPFLLLRPLSGAHSAAPNVPNREIIQDRSIQGFTTLLAGAVYCTTLFVACKLFLPSILVLYFEGIPSIQPAVDATLLGNVPTETLGLFFGLAARVFIFTPVAATAPTQEDQELAKFDPETATLGATFLWNVWGYSSRIKAAFRRTAVAVIVTGVQTFLQCRNLNGVESFGAAVYAAVWATGTMLTGQCLAYVLAV